jgi:hypothetical protein
MAAAYIALNVVATIGILTGHDGSSTFTRIVRVRARA